MEQTLRCIDCCYETHGILETESERLHSGYKFALTLSTLVNAAEDNDVNVV